MNMSSKAMLSGFLGLVTFLNSSNSVAETVLPEQGYTIPFTVNELVKTEGRCAQFPKTPCTQIKISYPRFRAPTPSAAIDTINAEVKQVLLQSVSNEQPPKSIEAAMVKFLQDYQSAIREFPQQSIWTDEKTVEVIQNRPNLLSLKYSHYWYTGGAHPNSSRTYWHFNPTTGKPIQLSDLFVEGYAPKLNAIAEKHFRQSKKLSADASLNQAGFWFENDKFQINTNFAMTSKGLIFFFNTYEIGPYVIGPTELQIPYTELKGLIKDRAQSLLPKP